MATSFKVPSSPAKSIFEIDEFLGVDLTNSGTNVNEHRSPNAPNMVRHVPGKVRKRTGYTDRVMFTDFVDVNRAKNTSDEWEEYRPEGTTYGEATVIHEFYEKLPSDGFKARYEIQFLGKYVICLGSKITLNISSEEETEEVKTYSGDIASGTASSIRVYVDGDYSEENYIRVRKVMITRETKKDDPSDIEWKIAPEDRGTITVENNEIAPIYGVHSIKTTEEDGNRVANVNRVLATSNEPRTIEVTASWQVIYDLADYLSPKRKIYLDLDYTLSGEPVWIYVGESSKKLSVTSDELHASYEITVGEVYNTPTNVQVMVANGSASTLVIKNLSVVYEKNEQYTWTPAPEDSLETFDLKNIYFVDGKNSGVSEEVSKQIDVVSQTNPMIVVDICNAEHNAAELCHVDMYVTTTSYINATSVELKILDSRNVAIFTKTYPGNLASEHIDEYIFTKTAEAYVKSVKVTYTLDRQTTYETQATLKVAKININKLTPRTDYTISSKQYIYHVGNKFFLRLSNEKTFRKVYEDANRHSSSAWQLGENLVIVDGKNVYSYSLSDESVSPIGDKEPYIPTVTISKYPNGGGVSYEAINMLTPAFYETFLVTEDSKEATQFNLSFLDLDSTKVTAWLLQYDGSWKRMEEGNGFTVMRNTGQIYFTTAPGKSPLTGEDNVKILAYKTFPGYKERVTKCTIGTLFGVNGASDRLFLSGNPDYPNWDFYSEQNNATYFPDTGYSALGLSSSAIVGYALVNNYLATFKDEYEPSQSVFIREGDLLTDPDTKISNPTFKLINTLQGNGAIATHSFGYLQTEPLFLTRSGVYAITAQDITGEKYSQNRSFFLNGELTKEKDLENAFAVVYNDMYILAVNSRLYILDGLQPIQTDRSAPYSTRQYVGFYCTDIPALCMWTSEQALWFGTTDGRVCSFATDIEDLESYNDNGEPIYCCWETPDLDGKLFYKNKSFRYIAIRMMAALKTSVALWSMARGAWSFIKEDNNTGIFFDFENIDFEAFSFSTDRSDKVAHSKIRVKKVDKARFKIENGKLNEPFGLMNLALEYVESGNYKG